MKKHLILIIISIFILLMSFLLIIYIEKERNIEKENNVIITIIAEKTIFNYNENIYINIRIENHGEKNIEREDYSYTIQIVEKNGKRAYHLFCYYNASMGSIPPNDSFEEKINILEYSFDEKHPEKHLNHLPQGTYEIKAIYGDRRNPWYDPKYIPYGRIESNSIEITIMGNSSQLLPTNLTAALSDSNVNLTWNPPSNDGNATITEYRIYRGTFPDSLELIASVKSSTIEYTDSNVSKGETYYYGVSAVNPIGESNLSEVVSIEIPEEKPAQTPSLGVMWIIGAIAFIMVIKHRRKKKNDV